MTPFYPFPYSFMEIIHNGLNGLKNNNNAGHLDEITGEKIRNKSKANDTDDPIAD